MAQDLCNMDTVFGQLCWGAGLHAEEADNLSQSRVFLGGGFNAGIWGFDDLAGRGGRQYVAEQEFQVGLWSRDSEVR